MLGVDLTDDGDPGPWGNTYEGNTDGGRWVFDQAGQAEAHRHVAELLTRDREDKLIDRVNSR